MIPTRDVLILCVVAVISCFTAFAIRTSTNTANISAVVDFIQDDAFAFDSVHAISIQKNGKTISMERKDGTWWQVQPFSVRLDSVSMHRLVKTVQGVQQLGILELQSADDSIGLGEGTNSITLFDGTESLTIQLGRKTLGGRAYARLHDKSAVLIDQSLHRFALDMDDTFWRDVRVFPDFAIDGVRISRVVNGDRLLLDRTSGQWKMLEPVSARVDQGIITEWIGRLAAARIGSYVLDEPDDLALFGLHNPVATFTVENSDGVSYTLLVGGRVSAGSQDRYVMMEGCPVVCKVQWDSLSQLFPAAEIYVDATGSAVSKFDIKQFVVRSNGKELLFERNLDTWVNSDGEMQSSNAVDSLLVWLLETKPPQVSIGEYPRSQELATVTLIGYDRLPLDTVRIAQSQEGGLIVENGDNVLRLHVPESITYLEPFIR